MLEVLEKAGVYFEIDKIKEAMGSGLEETNKTKRKVTIEDMWNEY